MPYKDPDPSDPNVLVGVVLPAEAETMQEMAYAFAEEFARMGYSKTLLLSVFKNPFYAAAHGIYQTLGEAAVQMIINECVRVWGRSRITVQEVPDVQVVQNVLNPLNGLNGLNPRREEKDRG